TKETPRAVCAGRLFGRGASRIQSAPHRGRNGLSPEGSPTGPARPFMLPLRFLVWGIAALVAAGLVVRPFRVPGAVWAVAGAILVIALGLLPLPDALAAIERGSDVYLFLAGMMLLSEVARREGLFDWIAAHAARSAQGSAPRLFLLLY